VPFQPCCGEDTLCGDVGLLALLSKELALRSSCGDCRGCVGDALESTLECVGDRLSESCPIGTESVMLPCVLTADVSMVIVGARLRPSEGVLGALPSAIVKVAALGARWLLVEAWRENRG
jgi:hypothetical protein